jgi:hypothetical protein
MIQPICDCTPEQRNYLALFLWGVGLVLTGVVVWAWIQGRRRQVELQEQIASSPFAYEPQGQVYQVWDKRNGQTLYEARTEAEAVGFIRRMSQLDARAEV